MSGAADFPIRGGNAGTKGGESALLRRDIPPPFIPALTG